VLAAVVLPDGIRWIEKAGVQSGDTVVVLGPGPQGLASTIAAKTRGASRIIVVGTSRDLRRLELAKQFGADHTVVSDQEGVRGIVAALTQNEMADVVIECAGTQETIQLGIDLLRPTGTCVLVGIPTDSPLALSPIRIAKDELTLAGGRSPLPWAVEAAIKLIESGRFAFDRIVSHTFPLRQAEAALRAMSRDDVRDAEVVKVAIKP
jgi:threonine dehydrogenase-like Zn-dependent dehydrogenase